MSQATLVLFASTAAATALIHTLIPDHWLPFVLIGRARGWAPRTVALVSGLSALIHVVLSMLLGLLALAIGLTAAEALGETLARAGALLLVVFGLGYAVWAWRNRGHFHPGGAKLHRNLGHAPHGARQSGQETGSALYEADADLIEDRPGWSALSLAVIIGINPCVLMLPLLLASASYGASAVGVVVAAYSLPTIALMIGLSVLGVVGTGRIRLPGAARHMELASGLLIALVGVVFWLFEG